MTKQEFANIAFTLRTYYGNTEQFQTGQAIELWYRKLHDLDYHATEVWLDKWIQTSRKIPTIADFRMGVSEVTGNKAPDFNEAWKLVDRAVHKFGYSREEEALEWLGEMNPAVRTATEQLGWQKICGSENVESDRARFIEFYETVSTKQNHESSMSGQLNGEINLLRELRKRGKIGGNDDNPMLLGVGR